MHITIDIKNETIFVSSKSIIDEISTTEVLEIGKLFEFYDIKKDSNFNKLFELIESNPLQIVHIDYNTDKDTFHNISTIQKNPNTLSVDETNKVYKLEDSVILQEINNVELILYEKAKEAELNSRNYFKDENGVYTFNLDIKKTRVIQYLYNRFGEINESNLFYGDYKFKSVYLTKQLIKDRIEREYIVYNIKNLTYEVINLFEADFVEIDKIINNKLNTTYDAIILKTKEVLACNTKEELEAVDLSCDACK